MLARVVTCRYPLVSSLEIRASSRTWNDFKIPAGIRNRAMNELERDMEHMDENNPKHMAHMMKKMKDVMPPGSVPKEMDEAIRRLEAGEDPEKIEEDLGDLLGGMGDEDEMGMGAGGYGGGYSKDSGLYDY